MKRSAVESNDFRLPLLSCAVISALLAACDARHPLAPTNPAEPAAPPPVRTASLPPPPAPVDLGSVFIGVPASTSAADARAVEQDWKIVGAFEDSTWILVEIEGGVTHAANPACAALPPFWRCGSFPLAGITAGPSTPFTSGRVDLWENGAGAPLHYRPAGGDPGALSARALSFRTVPGSVSARRHVQVAGAIEPMANQPSHGTYLLSGGQTVRLRAIPPPLGISGPADLAPGETGTYAAAPLFGLQLANPYGAHHLPPGGYGWTYHPDDTAAVARKRVFAGYPIWHCTNQPTCDVELPRSGRLAVFAYVEDQLVGAYSDVIRVGKPRLRVRCEPHAAVRGDTITCNTTVEPAQAFTIISRRAVGKENDFQIVNSERHPHAAGQADVWAGVAIAPTRIRVAAEVGPDTLQADAEFDVTGRPWVVYEITNPRVDTALGPSMTPYLNVLGEFVLSDLPVRTAAIFRAASGPNAGVMMLRTQPMYEDPRIARIYLHPALFPPPAGLPWSDPAYAAWYNDQNGTPSGTCKESHFPEIRKETARHEGATLAYESHAGITNRLFKNRRLHEQFEQVYAAGVSEDSVRELAYGRYEAWYRHEYEPAHDAFDSEDYPAIGEKVGCSMDKNPSDS